MSRHWIKLGDKDSGEAKGTWLRGRGFELSLYLSLFLAFRMIVES